jgi:NADH-quinone oxidoreductase subunit L
MFLALGAGAYTAAIFHVMTHAFFKALLFLGAGSVIHAMGGEQDMRHMGGLKKSLPITHITFLIGCLAIAGIPPLSGFFSKDEILAAAYSKHVSIWILALIAALMTAFYMFRLYAMTFRGQFRGTEDQKHHLHESPLAMTLPLIILAILSVAGGWVGIPEFIMKDAHCLSDFLEPVFRSSLSLMHPHSISHATEYLLVGISVSLVLVSLFLALKKFSSYKDEGMPSRGFSALLENKWYVDEVYDKIISKPLFRLSSLMNNILEIRIIDALVNGVGRLVHYGSRQLRLLQSGQVGAYVLLMTIGLLLLFILKYYF